MAFEISFVSNGPQVIGGLEPTKHQTEGNTTYSVHWESIALLYLLA